MTKTILIILFLGFHFISVGQEDRVLMSINDVPVYVSEFSYIYEKNNRDKADYSKESVEDYLDLYKNFKLKVHKAKDLNYHTEESYINELAGYRRQLSNGYVYDKEVIEYLAEQLYERKKYDIRLSHILIRTTATITEDEKARAREQLQVVRDLYTKGGQFEELVREFSADAASVPFDGDIGYITSPLPDGYLTLEDMAYQLNVGELSDIVETDLGFHLIKVTDKRPARGSMQAQHILIKTHKNGIRLADSERRIREIYKRLTTTKVAFEDVAGSLSEDAKTKSNGGSLGYFGIGRYEAAFEDAAFALEKDGDMSEPFETSFGWHIVRRTAKRQPQTKGQIKELLKGQMASSRRVSLRQEELVKDIQTKAPYSWNREALKIFRDSIDDSFVEYNWKVPSFSENELIRYGKDSYSLLDFGTYCRSNSRVRLKSKNNISLRATTLNLFNAFVNDKAMDFAQNRLEDHYADFKNLMREYEEGILLFEITKTEVWDRASNDSLGLKEYFEDNKDRYNWEERAELTVFTIESSDRTQVAKVFTDIKTMSTEDVLMKYKSAEVKISAQTDLWETSSETLKGLPMISGHITLPKIDASSNISTCRKVEKIHPTSAKTLQEARGYIVSDYQELLEQQWLQQLNKEYKVVVNDDVLNSLIVSQ